MKFLQKITLPLLAVLAVSFAPPAAVAEKAKAPAAKPGQEIIDVAWTKRCSAVKTEGKPDRQYCEIYTKMQTKKDNLRVAEFGIGFPDKKDEARGVAIFPLGMLLEPGVLMKVDDGKPAAIKIRYCLNSGCFSYMKLGKEMLDAMKNGKTLTFSFKALSGRPINLIMKLDNFGKALEGIQ
jgi:invasion protein IalB